MREEEIKNNFAKNVKLLRKQKSLTQSQLGEQLGYSDKSISKWENGDVVPDVVVMDHIASFFGLTINDLIGGETVNKFAKRHSFILIIIASLFISLTMASVVYFFLTTFSQIEKTWLVYIYSLPLFSVVFIVLSSIFYNYKLIISAISTLIWTIAISLYLAFLDRNIWTIFIICVFLQIVFIFFLFIIREYKKRKNKE